MISVFLAFPWNAIAVSGYTLYEFQGGNNSLYTVSCGTVSAEGWKVTGGSCNFYTASTHISAALENTKVIFSTTLKNNGTLDSRDFAWVFYYLNDKVVKTVTVRGDMAHPAITLKDSLNVTGNDVIRMRISFICDKSDEQWLLPDGELTYYIPSEAEESAADSDEPVSEPGLVDVITDDEGTLVTWRTNETTDGMYFLVERSPDGNDFEFAGYVNSPAQGAGDPEFRFREMRRGETFHYRVTGISSNGQKLKVIGTVVTPAGDMTAQSP